MNKEEKAFALLVKLTESFKYRGWVNGLSACQYESLNEAQEYINKINNFRKAKKEHPVLAKRLKKKGHTIREIATILGYKHPGSISHLLSR